MTPIPFALSVIDRGSPVWGSLMDHWSTKIEQLRTRLEGDMTDIEAAKIRGRIAEIRSNLSLDQEFPAAPD